MTHHSTSLILRRTTQATVVYLTVTATLVVVFLDTLDRWPIFVGTHLTMSGLLIWLSRLSAPPPLLRAFRDWHPIVLLPLLYKEVEVFAAAFGDWGLTTSIPALEATLFNGQPSLYLSEQWPSVALSEYLHFCYLSYVLVIPGLAGYWYATGRRVAFHELVLVLALAMFGSYVFFILFPVDSPYYVSDRLGPPVAGHLFFDLVHEVSARGGARGGAFPSAHVSGSVLVWLVAWRHQRLVAYLLTPLIGGVLVATVYGRFHYAVDTLAGIVVALAVFGLCLPTRTVRTTGAG